MKFILLFSAIFFIIALQIFILIKSSRSNTKRFFFDKEISNSQKPKTFMNFFYKHFS